MTEWKRGDVLIAIRDSFWGDYKTGEERVFDKFMKNSPGFVDNKGDIFVAENFALKQSTQQFQVGDIIETENYGLAIVDDLFEDGDLRIIHSDDRKTKTIRTISPKTATKINNLSKRIEEELHVLTGLLETQISGQERFLEEEREWKRKIENSIKKFTQRRDVLKNSKSNVERALKEKDELKPGDKVLILNPFELFPDGAFENDGYQMYNETFPVGKFHWLQKHLGNIGKVFTVKGFSFTNNQVILEETNMLPLKCFVQKIEEQGA